MKKFLTCWLVYQLFFIGYFGMMFDLDRKSEGSKVDCEGAGYKIVVSFVDITVPLIHFTTIGPKGCK